MLFTIKCIEERSKAQNAFRIGRPICTPTPPQPLPHDNPKHEWIKSILAPYCLCPRSAKGRSV